MDSLKTRNIQQVIDASLKLVLEQGVKQSELYDIIRNALKERVKDLPKQKVLYNACHGGFGFSKEFNAFLLQYQNDQEKITIRDSDKRQFAIQYIVSFADTIIDTISEKHQFFEDLLYCFQYYDFNTVFINIAKIIKNEKDVTIMEQNISLLRQYLQEDPKIPTEPVQVSHWIVSFVKTNFTRYHPDDLRYFLEEYDKGDIKSQYIQKTEQLKTTILQHFPETLLIAMKTFYTTFEEDKNQEDYGLILHNRNKNSFVKLINKYDITCTDSWVYQSYYDISAIFFLLNQYQQVNSIYPKERDVQNTFYDVFKNQFVERDETLLYNMKETFGLLCASSTYAKLKIATLSPLLEWDIVEYDGLERVHTV
jgi:hypothetical protein